MRNIKLVIEYDGTDFCGWQIQPNGRTVQEVIEKSLQGIINENVKIYGSGRTDTGVHAFGQVANFLCQSKLPADRLKSAFNGTLPKDVRVISAEEVPESFNARYDAKKREYIYKLAKYEKAINRSYTYYFKGKLDFERIREGSRHLIGEHNFRSFCPNKYDDRHYICTVETLDWIETDDLFTLRIIANRFLHHMIRVIVGTLLEVSAGRFEPDYVKSILKARDRTKAGKTVSPRGLYLLKVYY